MPARLSVTRAFMILLVVTLALIPIDLLMLRAKTNHLPPSTGVIRTAASWSSLQDTAILITSAWIPTHPSTEIIERVINSTARLRGVSPHAPIFVTIDHFKTKATPQQVAALDKYTLNLQKIYLLDPAVHIIPSMEHWHIGGNVLKGLQLIQQHFPKVEFLYSLQHDFEFIRDVDHLGLAQILRDRHDVNYKRNDMDRLCGNPLAIRIGQSDTVITKSSKYSDNNHLVRFEWYKNDVIEALGHLKRPPESPMMFKSAQCEKQGLYTYALSEAPVIKHLDGRHSQRSPNQTKLISHLSEKSLKREGASPPEVASYSTSLSTSTPLSIAPSRAPSTTPDPSTAPSAAPNMGIAPIALAPDQPNQECHMLDGRGNPLTQQLMPPDGSVIFSVTVFGPARVPNVVRMLTDLLTDGERHELPNLLHKGMIAVSGNETLLPLLHALSQASRSLAPVVLVAELAQDFGPLSRVVATDSCFPRSKNYTFVVGDDDVVYNRDAVFVELPNKLQRVRQSLNTLDAMVGYAGMHYAMDVSNSMGYTSERRAVWPPRVRCKVEKTKRC